MRFLAGISLMASLAGCSAGAIAGMNDPRAKALIDMPEGQYQAVRQASINLSNQCGAYDWNPAIDLLVSTSRPEGTGGLSEGALNASIKQEASLIRDGLRQRYGKAGACEVLAGEVKRGTPLGFLVEKRA